MQQISFLAQNRELDGDWPRGAGRHFYLIPVPPPQAAVATGTSWGAQQPPGS